MAQPLCRTTRNIKKVDYAIKSPTPPPTPPPHSAKTYRGKTFEFPEPYITYHGMEKKAGKIFKMPKDGGLSFVLFEINACRKVDDQCQFAGITCTDQGEHDDIVLTDQCKLWWWLGAALLYREDFIKIGFVNDTFYEKLLYKNYKCLYSVNDILYHQLIFYDAKRTPAPIKCVVIELDPDTHAGQNGLEYNIKMKEHRKRNGKTIKGGWTSEFRVDPHNESWIISELNMELQIARKSAKFGNHHYIEKYMRLRNPPLDLNWTSPFWAKPDKYEQFKNINLKGFNGIYSKNTIYKLLKRVFESFCDANKFNGYCFEITIKNIRNNIYLYGEDANEYIMEFGHIPYLQKIRVQFDYDDKYIIINIKKNIIKKEYNLLLIKKHNESEFILNSDVILKYDRELSRIFVHKFTLKLENRHIVKARNNGTI